MKIPITNMDIPIHNNTSICVSVRIEAEPKSTVHTSPDRFDEVEKILTSKYPIAKELTEINATAASPLILECWLVRKRRIADNTVIGATSNILLVKFNTIDMDIAPNATFANPSPIKENRFKTRVTPNKEEHNAINTPTIIA